jgi:hypothetical protein
MLNFFLSYVIPILAIAGIAFCYIWFFNRKLIVHFLIVLLFVFAYSLSNIGNITSHSPYNHYPLLADALLHGRASLDSFPGFHDVSTYQDKIYIAQPPLPAFLMLPFVLVYGKEFNDIIFTIILGAINCMLVYSMVLRLNNSLSNFKFSRAFAFFITLLFGFGTVHWEVTVRGTVWHTANIVTVLFVLLSVREALGKRRYALMGTFLALAVLARPSVVWAIPFFVVLAVKDHLAKKQVKAFFFKAAFFAIPFVCMGIFLGLWNWTRFGSPLDFGFAYMNHAEHLKANLAKYGTLNLYYLPINLNIAFLLFARITKVFPYLIPSPEGMAIQYTSPFFLYLFAPLVFFVAKRITDIKMKLSCNTEIVIGSVLAVVCTAIPLLLYFNTGWVQFGYRYLLDYIPFLMILLAYAMRGKISPLGIGLGVLAFIVNLYGMIMYIYFETPIMTGVFG